MWLTKFTVIFHLLAMIFLIHGVTSELNANGLTPSNDTQSYDDNSTEASTEFSNTFGATTPAISVLRHSKLLGFEEGLDDYEEDEAIRNNANSEVQQVQSRQLSDGFNPLLQIFNTVSNALMQSAQRAAQSNGASIFGTQTRDIERNVDDDDAYDYDNVTDSSHAQNASLTTTTETAVAEGRYIKGDPLNGYYDFIITEGSYKFWVVFQLGTAALLIYSTLAAIYYSKVNPLTSDYDYVDYLSRSFKDRSMDSEDVDDGEEQTTTTPAIESGRTYLSSLAHNKWAVAAAYGFEFAMNAIDKIPQ